MNQQFGPLLYTISVWALPAIIAITFHEAAHGFVARLLGDDTAWRLGRILPMIGAQIGLDLSLFDHLQRPACLEERQV